VIAILKNIVGASIKSYVLLLLSFLVVACFEVVGIGVIPVFVAAIAAPEMLHGKLDFLLNQQGRSQEQVVLVLGGVLVFFFLLKNVLLAVIASMQARFIANCQADLSSLLFRSYLRQSYVFHLGRHSAELLRNVTGVTFSFFSGVIVPGCVLITELIVAITVAVLLMFANPISTLVAVTFLAMFMLAFYRVFKTKIEELGAIQQADAAEMVKCVSQGLGGLKEAKVLGRESFFIERFEHYIRSYSRANNHFGVINQVPRYFIESLTVVGIVLIVVVMFMQGNSAAAVIPVLSLFAVAAIRLIPSANRILGSVTSIRFNKATIDILGRELAMVDSSAKQVTEEPARQPFNEMLRLEGLSFFYPHADRAALQDISIAIPKGSMVAFVGKSGAGKSTLADIILGLYMPTSGSMSVDGIDISDDISGWQKNIGYVPQSIYISDDSIRSNVAFGIAETEIDDEKVRAALGDAQLLEFVDGLPEGSKTVIGEHGSRLSGGQRQRIGIARAMYHNPDVLVMDEATSALDNKTEDDIANALQALKGVKTIIVIAHRLSTIKRSETLFLLSEGKLLASGSYDDFAANNEAFRQLMNTQSYAAP